MGCCSPACQKWTTFSISAIFVLLGILIVVFWGSLYSTILRHELSLQDSQTTGYTNWKETPIPMYLEFYLWNWTNADEVVKSGWKNKPKFEECGPYTYHEHHIRENITFNDNNNTITYKTKRVWKYLPDKSKGSLEDKITTVNPIVATVGYFIRNRNTFWDPLVKLIISFLMKEKGERIMITKTADEFLFKGYKDPILRFIHTLNQSSFNIPFQKFGWFYARNESIDFDGVFNMYSGSDDIRKLGRILEWNYSPTVKYYNDSCGKVVGTSGELWYPPMNDSEITVFASDICGSVVLNYAEPYSLNGIQGKKYVAREKVFDNGTLHPEMACYRPPGVSLPSGVRNVSRCKFGAPAFVSFPHFYLADPYYLQGIEGMQPNPKEHTFYMALEPNTGLPLKVNAAIQLNLKIQPIKGISILEKVKTMYMPMFWFRQRAELSQKLCDEAKVLLVLPSVGLYTGSGILAIGALLLIVGAFITYRKGWKGITVEEEQLINQQSF